MCLLLLVIYCSLFFSANLDPFSILIASIVAIVVIVAVVVVVAIVVIVSPMPVAAAAAPRPPVVSPRAPRVVHPDVAVVLGFWREKNTLEFKPGNAELGRHSKIPLVHPKWWLNKLPTCVPKNWGFVVHKCASAQLWGNDVCLAISLSIVDRRIFHYFLDTFLMYFLIKCDFFFIIICNFKCDIITAPGGPLGFYSFIVWKKDQCACLKGCITISGIESMSHQGLLSREL